MPKISALLVIALLAASVTASAQQRPSDTDTAAEAPPAGAPDLRGTWAQKVVTTAISKVPIVGKVTTRTVAVQRVRIEGTAPNLRMRTEVCDIGVNSSIDSVKTTIPRRFMKAMGVTVRPARLVAVDGGYALDVPRHVQVLGAELREPTSEYLPKKADDPRVVDQDKDGHPGVTIRVSGLVDGSIYVVHRGSDRMRGQVLDADRVAGTVKWSQQQVVLDSTSMFLGNPPASRPDPSPKKNYFEMKRVPDGSGCGAVLNTRF